MTGSARYPGAAVLSARAAARTNSGMVRYMGPQHAQDMVLSALPEAVIGKGRVQSWVVGSGVPAGDDETADEDMQRETIAALLKHYTLERSDADGSSMELNERIHAMPPIVVDAGALDLLPEHVPAQVVITPHVGELARLLNRIEHTDIDVDDVYAEPLAYARRAHELTGATVLLKGAVTIVVGEDGDGEERVILSGRAPAWLATAGTYWLACWAPCSHNRMTCSPTIRRSFRRLPLRRPICMVLRRRPNHNPISAAGIVRESTGNLTIIISARSDIRLLPATSSTASGRRSWSCCSSRERRQAAKHRR